MEHIHLPASDMTDAQRLVATQTVLRRSGYRSLAGVECEVRGGTVVLSGEVPSYYIKQLAQTLVQRLACIERIENQIRVAGDPAEQERSRG